MRLRLDARRGLIFVAIAALAASPLFAQDTRRFRSESQAPPRAENPRPPRAAGAERLLTPLGSAANALPGEYSRRFRDARVEAGFGRSGLHRGPVAIYPNVVFGGYPLNTGPVTYAPPAVDLSSTPQGLDASLRDAVEPRGQAPVVLQPVVIQPPAPTPRAEPEPAPQPPPRPQPTEPQRVTFELTPADATVWLDGERLGSARTLDSLSLAPGVYILEIEHPNLSSQRLVFGISDEPVQVAIDLAADRPSRRTRVR
ncbi:MAG: hypothetical protein AAGN46_07850 [Acidobacteriota bacterium]